MSVVFPLTFSVYNLLQCILVMKTLSDNVPYELWVLSYRLSIRRFALESDEDYSLDDIVTIHMDSFLFFPHLLHSDSYLSHL